MSNTQVIQQVKLNLGGCLPVGSEITDVQVECNPKGEDGVAIVDGNGRPVPQLSIVQIDERGNQTTFVTDLCPDKFMKVVDNQQDGTVTATNVDGVKVTWCKETTISGGEGIGFSGAICDPKDPLVITLALCGLGVANKEEVDAAATVLYAGCVDGKQKLFPRETLCQMMDGLARGANIVFDGTENITVETVDPKTCELKKLSIAKRLTLCEMLDKLDKGGDIVHDGSQKTVIQTVDPVTCETKKLTLAKFPDIPTIPESACIPVSEGMPTAIPVNQESRIVLDCDGCVWYYTCLSGWTKSCGGLPELELLDPTEVDDICNSLRFMVHYQGGDCVSHKDMTLAQIAEWIQGCLCALIGKDNTQQAKAAMTCVNGKLVERPIPTLCESMNSLVDSGGDIPIGSTVPFITANGRCRRGKLPESGGELEFVSSAVSGGACFDLSSSTGTNILIHINNSAAAPYIRNIVGTSAITSTPNLSGTPMTFTNTYGYDVWVQVVYEFGLLSFVQDTASRTSVSLTGISGSGTLPPDPSYSVSGAGVIDGLISQSMSVAMPSIARNIDLVGTNNLWNGNYGSSRNVTMHRVPPLGSLSVDIDLYYAMGGVLVDDFVHVNVEGSYYVWKAK